MTEKVRTASTGIMRTHIEFIDASVLPVWEYLDLDIVGPRLMYSYTYLDAQGNLRFRYDNIDHYRRLHLPTHPRHKHDDNQNAIVASAAPRLDTVLAEVELVVEICSQVTR